jgi:hypothetical protein
MMHLTERMDIHGKHVKLGKPTLHRTEVNRYPLNCGICRELYFVDEGILRRVHSALEGDPSEMPFSCEACEEHYAEAAYASN